MLISAASKFDFLDTAQNIYFGFSADWSFDVAFKLKNLSLSVGQFVNNVRILKNFSSDRNPHVMKNGILEDNVNYEKHKYSDEPIIDLSIWTHAYQ